MEMNAATIGIILVIIIVICIVIYFGYKSFASSSCEDWMSKVKTP